MSWIGKLYETYENCDRYVYYNKKEFPLLPVGHTTKEGVHICITLDINGNFKRAEVLDKDSSRTIIPVTEHSAGRTSGSAPHPLADQLQYIAQDYTSYGGQKKSYYTDYQEQLKKWVDSQFSTDEIKAVYKYISTQDVIADLIKSKILCVDDNLKLLKKWIGNKNDRPPIFKRLDNNQTQSDCFIRWNVEKQGKCQTELQSNGEVWNSWIKYYLGTKSRKDICYVSGQENLTADQHAKKILPSESNAKLISSNDNIGFTFRGKFITDSQACNISYDVSQKAHNALTWLIRRQGTTTGSQSVVAWAVKGCEIPDPIPDTYSLVMGQQIESEQAVADFNAGQNIGTALTRLINGYSANLGNTDDVVVIALDSLTSGRAAIKYYKELTGSEYLERIQRWHNSCCWRQEYDNDKIFIGAPSPKDIALAAYGTYNKEDNKIELNDKLLSATIERLLPCIVDEVMIPNDIVRCCVTTVTRRQALKLEYWEKFLGITCALYKYQNIERNYSMELEADRKTRDYLYGQLLALADYLEDKVLWLTGENKKEDGRRKERSSNALRLMQRFAMSPYSTWLTIELALTPYRQRLKTSNGGLYIIIEKEFDRVMESFNEHREDFVSNAKLSGEFLLGFHCQRTKLWKKQETLDNGIDCNKTKE